MVGNAHPTHGDEMQFGIIVKGDRVVKVRKILQIPMTCIFYENFL